MTLISVQLFEKLKLQESSAGDEPEKKHDAREKATEQQPADHTSERGHSRTASKLSDSVKTKHKVSVKAQGPEVCRKKESQMYGKIHTRHINQLFIRGENVLLVNPQPLWL